MAYEAPALAIGAHVKGLAAERCYRFRVKAFNLIGESEASQPSPFVQMPKRLDYIMQQTKKIMAEQPELIQAAMAENELTDLMESS